MRRYLLFIVITSFLAAFQFNGCNKESSTESTKNPQKAVEKVTQANQILFLHLAMIASSPDPTSFNLSSSNALYNEALSYNPDNLDAHFGAALTGVLTLLSDSTLNSLGSMSGAFPSLKTKDIVATFKENGLRNFTATMKTAIGENIKSLLQPSKAISRTLSKSQFDTPPLSYYQDIVETKILPVFSVAIQHLQRITQDSEYVFLITPEMIGGTVTYRIDLTEVYLLLAVFQYIDASCSMLVPYNFDYNSSYADSVVHAWQNGSPFLALRSNGAQSMHNIRAEILNAATSFENGITFLMNEPVHQEQDIIVYNPAHSDEYLEIIAGADSIVTIFSGPITTENGVTINLVNLFENPITDIKAKLPAYNVSAQLNQLSGKYDAVLTWQASTFENWAFPDPVFNGFLPGMTDAELKLLLEIDASTWKAFVIIPG